MKTLKIGIVEDELIIATNIIRTLTEIGYRTTEAAISYSEAVGMLHEEKPDLVLLDINLGGKKDGVDVAEYINENQKIPFIFLTANSDITTLERAKKVAPSAYLMKPFTKEDLFVSIEVAISNFSKSKPKADVPKMAHSETRDYLFLKNKQSFTKVMFSDILFVEGQDNYVTLHLASGGSLLHRSKLAEMEELLPANEFYRVQRSFIVALKAIQQITDHTVFIHAHQIPVSKDRIKGLLTLLGIEE